MWCRQAVRGPRGPLLVPASWCSFPRVISFPWVWAGFSNFLLRNRIWQKAVLRLDCKKTVAFILASLPCLLQNKPAAMTWSCTKEIPTWKGAKPVRSWGPQSNNLRNRILLTLLSVRLWDETWLSLSSQAWSDETDQELDCNLRRDNKLEARSHS